MSTIPLLRTSERSSFTTCRQKWWWGYVEQMRPKQEGRALWFGDLVHQALAAYYTPGRKRGPRPAATFEQLYERSVAEARGEGFDVWSDEEWVNAGELGVKMLEGYVERWHDHDQIFEVIASEQQFRFPIRRARGERPIGIYVGTIDGVWKDLTKTRRPYLFAEHKTATAISLDGLPLDEQAGSYWTYGPAALKRMGILAENLADEIECVLYNFLRKATADTEGHPVNEDGHRLNKPKKPALVEYCRTSGVQGWAGKTVDELIELIGRDKAYQACGEVSKVQPAPLFQREPIFRDRVDRERVHARVIQQLDEITKARNGELAVYKIPGPWYNPHCRGCSFRDICELHETGNDWEAMAQATMEGWNPYDQHEIEHDERR